ncbi:phage antirepressor KilAC domain-containing protein [Clostridioides sp. ES-S-0049-03]|uniref:phage antirepressor KilAC domain-containing protein n=1 Tax=Clostridioides sp. ES-S-0049-03 TaxID=2770779 RepID=UPI001D10EEBC|nr:phage antirepressor KilAC domain-containing protein [Clostridioides sp. ES-S-0049-03]
MNNLQLNNKNTITTLEIADMLEINHWEVLRKLEGTEKVKGIIDVLGSNNFVVTDYFIKTKYLSVQNKEMPCYNVTKLGCDFLANKFTGEKGIVFTARYVKRFNEMEQELKEQQPKLPATYKEALQQLLIEVEEKEYLQLQSKMKDQVINELKPKADYTDTILKSDSLVTITQIAKDYGMSGTEMNKLLHKLKVQYKQSEQWLLYKEHQGKRYTHSETIEITRTNGNISTKMITKWTQKGRLFLHDLLRANNILPEIEKNNNQQLSMLG